MQMMMNNAFAAALVLLLPTLASGQSDALAACVSDANNADPAQCAELIEVINQNLLQGDTQDKALILSVQALAYARRGDLATASSTMTEALSGDNTLAPETLANAGTLALYRRQPETALSLYDRAQAAAEAQGATLPDAMVLNRAMALRAMGRFDQAAVLVEGYRQRSAARSNSQSRIDAFNSRADRD